MSQRLLWLRIHEYKESDSIKKYLAAVLIAAVILLSGCSKVVLKSDSDPNVDMATLQTFYVRNFTEDKRGIEKTIAAQLEKLG